MLEDYPDLVVRIIVGGLVIAGLWYALQPQCVFALRIEQGSISKIRGTVHRSFVHAAESICREARIARGQIRGLRRGRSVTLAFSGAIPAECRQQLRNLWQVQGSLR